MATFVVIRDRYRDTHAREVEGEANPEAIERTARELVDSYGLADLPGRNGFDLGICVAGDGGAARLLPWTGATNGAITPLYRLIVESEG